MRSRLRGVQISALTSKYEANLYIYYWVHTIYIYTYQHDGMKDRKGYFLHFALQRYGFVGKGLK